MREPIMKDFALQEYEDRMRKLICGMQKLSLDAVILSTEENTRYFSGLRSIVWGSKIAVPGVLIVTANGDMTIVSSASNQPTAIATSVLEPEKLIAYSRRSEMSLHNLKDAMIYALDKFGIRQGRIGMELGEGFRLQFAYPDQKMMFEILKDAEIKDAAQLIWSIRCVKSPAEIERLRMACKITDAAFQKGYDSIRCGVTTEADMNRVIVGECYRLGADGILPLGIRCGRERYSQGNCPPSDRIIGRKSGEMMLVDGGARYQGYYCDIIREGVSGKPTDRQKAIYDVAVTGSALGLGKIAPGVPIQEVTRTIDEFFASKGYDSLNRYKGWTGHGVGLDFHELPTISAGCEQVFQPGMVMSLEPELFDPECGVFGVEQNFLVTETGCEVLSHMPTELICLPVNE